MFQKRQFLGQQPKPIAKFAKFIEIHKYPHENTIALLIKLQKNLHKQIFLNIFAAKFRRHL